MAIPTLLFGRTGHRSSRILFGAAALAAVDQATADGTLGVLLEAGVNHIDVAASYGDAELRVAPWLRSRRDDFFLATKTNCRRAGPARAELERSLQRLEVDHVDLWQLHNLVDPIEWDTALSPGGALEAAEAAREQGLCRHIGVTGHGVQMAASARRSLERFDFDSVLVPCNWPTLQLPYYAENFEALLATCRERRVAVQTIKAVALRPWLGREHTAATWYEPLRSQEDIDLAVWWAMGTYPDIFLNSVGDVSVLPMVLSAAARFERAPDDDVMRELSGRVGLQPLFV